MYEYLVVYFQKFPWIREVQYISSLFLFLVQIVSVVMHCLGPSPIHEQISLLVFVFRVYLSRLCNNGAMPENVLV